MAPRCAIETYLVSITNEAGISSLVGQTRCNTHSWYWPKGAALTEADRFCPIGRIEEATEAALAKIEQKATAND